jgi:hypothetical protein
MPATFSQLPGDLTITHVIGDEVNFTLDLDVDVTGYTFTAGVYVVSTNGFFGGGGGTINAVGATAITPTITVVNAAAGTLSWGVSEAQTVTLSPAIKYRHFVRWVTPAGVTRTVVSGDLVAKAP